MNDLPLAKITASEIDNRGDYNSVRHFLPKQFYDLHQVLALFCYWRCVTITLMAKPDKQHKPDDNQLQPGTVISPGSSSAGTPVSGSVPAVEPPGVEQQPESPVPVTDAEIVSTEQPEPQDSSFDVSESPLDGNNQKITWTASEFIAHDKSVSWYVVLSLVTVVLGAVVFLLNRDFISVSVVIISGLLLGAYAGHQPRSLEYALNNGGLSIGQKHYSYDKFKSFSIMKEGAFSSIMFMPLKRFAVALMVHYAPEDEEKILSILAERLPMEEPRYDLVDSLMRRIRF